MIAIVNSRKVACTGVLLLRIPIAKRENAVPYNDIKALQDLLHTGREIRLYYCCSSLQCNSKPQPSVVNWVHELQEQVSHKWSEQRV
jgi:hypothetical protein